MRGVKKANLPEKRCLRCGLPFTWRKKWARTWDEGRYCSDRCAADSVMPRSHGPGKAPRLREALDRVNDAIITVPGIEVRTIVLGGDALALRVCKELASISGHYVTALWDADDDLQARFERVGTRFARARYIAVQGLRRIDRRGHIVVCGAGNVGSRVIDELRRLDVEIVVVERTPTQDTVERSRERQFHLLTGDASKNTTLEIALGARARNADMPVVMRVRDDVFETAVRRHFGFDQTFGTAALAAPVFVGLTRTPGLRGRIAIGGKPYSIVEVSFDALPIVPPAEGCVPLGVTRDGTFVAVTSFDDVGAHDRVLMLFPVWRYHRDTVDLHAAKGAL